MIYILVNTNFAKKATKESLPSLFLTQSPLIDPYETCSPSQRIQNLFYNQYNSQCLKNTLTHSNEKCKDSSNEKMLRQLYDVLQALHTRISRTRVYVRACACQGKRVVLRSW